MGELNWENNDLLDSITQELLQQIGMEKHTISNRWALLSNVFMSFSSGKDRTNNAKTKQH